ncbi:MAG: hypothetical protein L6V84_06460 [Oscillospiraceae bacterium]|nr:MAG: hypothetical protein L6V84_06460 [Oscillospiraceae bacterium]
MNSMKIPTMRKKEPPENEMSPRSNEIRRIAERKKPCCSKNMMYFFRYSKEKNRIGNGCVDGNMDKRQHDNCDSQTIQPVQ